MKVLVTAMFLSVVMLTSYPAFAGCARNSCQVVRPCPTSCAPSGPAYGCNCTDRGMYYNTCISREVYCRAFGNVGAMED